jgi:hypothetical protein
MLTTSEPPLAPTKLRPPFGCSSTAFERLRYAKALSARNSRHRLVSRAHDYRFEGVPECELFSSLCWWLSQQDPA